MLKLFFVALFVFQCYCYDQKGSGHPNLSSYGSNSQSQKNLGVLGGNPTYYGQRQSKYLGSIGNIDSISFSRSVPIVKHRVIIYQSIRPELFVRHQIQSQSQSQNQQQYAKSSLSENQIVRQHQTQIQNGNSQSQSQTQQQNGSPNDSQISHQYQSQTQNQNGNFQSQSQFQSQSSKPVQYHQSNPTTMRYATTQFHDSSTRESTSMKTTSTHRNKIEQNHSLSEFDVHLTPSTTKIHYENPTTLRYPIGQTQETSRLYPYARPTQPSVMITETTHNYREKSTESYGNLPVESSTNAIPTSSTNPIIFPDRKHHISIEVDRERIPDYLNLNKELTTRAPLRTITPKGNENNEYVNPIRSGK